jgi:hypothetical protein
MLHQVPQSQPSAPLVLKLTVESNSCARIQPGASTVQREIIPWHPN